MLRPLLAVVAILSASSSNAIAQGKPVTTPTPSTSAADPMASVPMDKVSYFIGRNIGDSLRNQGLSPQVDKLSEGIADVLAGKPSRVPEAELMAAMEKFQVALQAVEVQKREEAAKVSLQYLAENGKRAGVTTTASGLQYEVLRAAEGPKPSATDTVQVHYRGTLINGKEFDSSYARNEPASFPLNRVISGWTEGLALMSKGAKFRFVIPGNLAYGDRGSPPDIGPNETLIFEVELLDIIGK
ncbi:MAG: hypothetical protein CFE28_10570 [Alphaproteobacteria bacterium PA2]|nr:MAG: hypothetical protein CFE28_10570 [Alphaproteobacteria bacterium PA2]